MNEHADEHNESVKDRKYALIHLNENDDERESKIEEIKKWIIETDELQARTDNFFILRFLRACKFDIKKTKEKFYNYHLQRTNVPEWFANRDPYLEEIQIMFEKGVFLPLRGVDREGRLVVIIRSAVHDPYQHELAQMLKASMMILDVAIREHENVTLHGIIAIVDMDGMTLGHALQLTPRVVKKLVHAWQGCYPLRIQSMDFINSPIFIDVVLRIFKNFMNRKLKSRINVWSSDSMLAFEKVPPENLPFEYGGNGGSLQELIEYWKGLIETNKEWLEDDEKYKIYE